jgi:hypothetical protein
MVDKHIPGPCTSTTYSAGEAREQIAEAVKAAEERDKNKNKTKSAGSGNTDKKG